jgi:hypothetical protein
MFVAKERKEGMPRTEGWFLWIHRYRAILAVVEPVTFRTRPCLVNNFRRLLVGPVPSDFALGPEPVERACAGLAREKRHSASGGPTPEPEGIREDLFPRHPLTSYGNFWWRRKGWNAGEAASIRQRVAAAPSRMVARAAAGLLNSVTGIPAGGSTHTHTDRKAGSLASRLQTGARATSPAGLTAARLPPLQEEWRSGCRKDRREVGRVRKQRSPQGVQKRTKRDG